MATKKLEAGTWRLAVDTRLDPETLLRRMIELGERLPDEAVVPPQNLIRVD